MTRRIPLASSWAKYHRATAHLKALDVELGRVMSEQNQPVTVDREVKNGQAVIRVTRVPEFREAGLFLGDAVTNYRAALDHLTWDLVKLGSEPRLSAQRAIHVQFPLAKSARDFDLQRDRRVPGIEDADWEIIRQYQPYRRGDRGQAMKRLRTISDLDKHRYIAPAVACATGFVGQVHLTGCTVHDVRRYSPKRALHVGTKLWTMAVTPTAPEYDVKIKSEITVRPSLDRGVPLLPAMWTMHEVVFEILSRFEERF